MRPLTPRERITGTAIAVAFLAAAVPLAFTSRAGLSDLPALALCIAVYAAASLVEFEVGTGSAVPTQLVLVPMLFVLPLGVVPLAAAARLRRRGPRPRRVPPRRIARGRSCSWGPPGMRSAPSWCCLPAGGGPPAWDRWPVYVAAFAAQFASTRPARSSVTRFALGVRPSLSLRAVGWVYGIDALLAPVGLAFALARGERPSAVLPAVPLARS